MVTGLPKGNFSQAISLNGKFHCVMALYGQPGNCLAGFLKASNLLMV
jgi:hypothetical protein